MVGGGRGDAEGGPIQFIRMIREGVVCGVLLVGDVLLMRVGFGVRIRWFWPGERNRYRLVANRMDCHFREDNINSQSITFVVLDLHVVYATTPSQRYTISSM